MGSAKEKEVKAAKTAERAKKSVERSAKKAKKDKERENKAVVKAEKSKKVAEKLKAEKAKEGAQKAAAAKEALDKEEASQRKLKEKKQKAAKAEQNEKEKEQKAREKDSKEKKAKNVAREKKRKEHAQKAKEKKSKRDAEEKASKEKAKKKAEERKAKAVAAEKGAKEKATKIAEKAAKQKVKENKKKAQRRELAEKRAQELEEKSKEKAEKDAKRAKEKAKKEAASKEKTRKAECKLKKLNREKHIKAAYPKKLSISYRGGWKYYGNQYAPLAVYAKGNVCQLEGTLRKTKNSNIVAKLNDHRCKPSSFSLSGLVWTRGNYMMMEESTELLETGESDGKTSKGKNQWSGAIEGLNGWQQKKTAISHKHGNLCVLAGQMEGQTWIKPSKDVQGTRYIAKLDGPCRPYKRLMFSTYGMPGGVPLRVDVLPDGRIEVEDVHNRALEPIVNLDGIVFSTVKGSEIKLNTGFTSYGQGYMRPQARQENGICHVQGLAKGSVSPRKVATLPTWCRPARTLSFNAPNNRYVHQLDVLPNGDVMLKSGANGGDKGKSLHGDKGEKGWKGASFVSLSQITFPIPYESAYGAIMNKSCT